MIIYVQQDEQRGRGKVINKLKKIREEKGFSQEELSKRANVSRTTISALENKRKLVVNNITLEKIANALNLRVSDIFFID